MRLYHCNHEDCTKAYGTLNHLNAHVAMQKHGAKRTPEEFKETRRLHKLRKKKEEEEARLRGGVLAQGQPPDDVPEDPAFGALSALGAGAEYQLQQQQQQQHQHYQQTYPHHALQQPADYPGSAAAAVPAGALKVDYYAAQPAAAPPNPYVYAAPGSSSGPGALAGYHAAGYATGPAVAEPAYLNTYGTSNGSNNAFGPEQHTK